MISLKIRSLKVAVARNFDSVERHLVGFGVVDVLEPAAVGARPRPARVPRDAGLHDFRDRAQVAPPRAFRQAEDALAGHLAGNARQQLLHVPVREVLVHRHARDRGLAGVAGNLRADRLVDEPSGLALALDAALRFLERLLVGSLHHPEHERGSRRVPFLREVPPTIGAARGPVRIGPDGHLPPVRAVRPLPEHDPRAADVVAADPEQHQRPDAGVHRVAAVADKGQVSGRERERCRRRRARSRAHVLPPVDGRG